MADMFTIGMILSAVDQASGVINRMCNNALTDLGKVQAKMLAVSESMKQIGKEALGAGLMTTGAIQKPLRIFADLDEAQRDLKTNVMDSAGAVGKELEKMYTLADRLGTDLPGDTKAMLNMFTALREQGVQTKSILMGTGEAAAQFAVLMKLPFAQGATYVAKFREVLGVADEDMIRYMDQLQRMKYASGIEVGDLAYTYKYMGPSLKSLNIQGLENAEKVGAVIGLMASNAIEGSQAGTGLANALSRMASISHRLDTKKIRELVGPILDAKGIKLSFFDDKGQFKGIEAMITELEKLRALNPQEKLIVLEKLFSAEAARPLSVLVEQGLTGYQEMINRMRNQADMQMKIKEIMSGTKMQWDTMTGTASNFMARMGGVIVQFLSLNNVLGKLNTVISKMDAWVQLHPKLAGALGAMVAIGGVALTLFGAVVFGLAMVFKMSAYAIGGIDKFTKFIQIAIPWVRLKSAELLRLIGYHKLMAAIEYRGGFWNAMQYWLLTTKYRVLEGVAALRVWTVAQLTAFRANFLTIAGLQSMARAFGATLLGGLRAAIVGIRAFSLALLTTPVGWISMAIAAAALLIYKFWGPISGFFKGLWTGIKEGLKGLVKMIYTLIKWLIGPVNDTGKAAEGLGLRFGRAIGGILSSILTLPYKMLTAGANIINSLYQGMMSVINKPVEAIKSLAQRLRNFLPFSPAKEGPLRDLNKVNIFGTIAQTMEAGPAISAMQRAMNKTRAAMMPPMSPALAAAGSGGGMPPIHVTQKLTFSGNVDNNAAQEMTARVGAATKEAIWQAIDEYFARKKRVNW